MAFCKTFETAAGKQILIHIARTEDEDGCYTVKFEAESTSEFVDTAASTLSFSTLEGAEGAFDSFDEEKARRYYEKLDAGVRKIFDEE